MSGKRAAGKVAIVTGAGRGIGRAVAERLAAEGASVVGTDVQFADREPGAVEHGGSLYLMRHDVRSARQWDAVVAEAEARYGPVSVLVNNAGIIKWNTPIRDTSEADYRETIEVNQTGVFLGMKHVLASMEKAGGGAMINFSSTAGLIGYWGIMPYVASKWAVRGMTKSAAIEFGPSKIRVNSVHPGFIRTAMTEGVPPAADQPLPRYAEPVEMASLVLFLASDEGAYCTGAEFVMDGGHTVGKTIVEQ